MIFVYHMRWYRAIDIEQLVGSIGGYIGLCLGFSIAQIPELIIHIVICAKKDYQKIKEKANRIPMTGVRVVVESTTAKNNIIPITKQDNEDQTEIRTITKMKIKSLEIKIEEASQVLLDIKKELSSNKIWTCRGIDIRFLSNYYCQLH